MLYICVSGVMGVFYLYSDVGRCRCSCMGSMSVSSCMCCMFVSCVHPVAVLNVAFCMTRNHHHRRVIKLVYSNSPRISLLYR